MNQTQMDDLKLFIDTTLSNRVRVIVEEVLEEKLDEKLLPIHRKIDDLAEIVSNIGSDIDNHEHRLRRHERQRA
jgi:hypothetical protein